MSADLSDVAKQLKDADKKVQLIYAFNGTGKTRLSREFVDLVATHGPSPDDEEVQPRKILYYNAHTEDLFYWDNDLEFGIEPKLKIQPNSFTDWILGDQGADQRIINYFQQLTGSRITPVFDEKNASVTFTASNTSYLITEDGQRLITEDGDFLVTETNDEIAKISRGEESNFIWSIFYTLLEQVMSVLDTADPEDRDTHDFDHLKYVFIDDPVSSLDENHLIELAVNLAGLIKLAPQELKFIITTHNPLFYNVLFNELGTTRSKKCYLLKRSEDGSFELLEKAGDSNRSFSYHLYLKQLIETAIIEGRVEKYHFTLLRNLYEKTASFLGYQYWTDLLPGDKDAYHKRIITFSSHRTVSNEEIAEPTEPEKQSVKLLLDNLVEKYGFWKPEAENND